MCIRFRPHNVLSVCSFIIAAQMPVGVSAAPGPATDLLAQIPQVRILQGNAETAYRDPLLYYREGTFYLFFSMVREEESHLIYWYVAESTSTNLRDWSNPLILTAKDQNLNFSSPGSITEHAGKFLLAVQTYPIVGAHRGDPIRFTDDRARLFTLESRDLKNWGPPQLIRVKGRKVDQTGLGKMIDAYIFPDKDTANKWWCLYKQDGKIRESSSGDLETWEPTDVTLAEGENPCMLVDQGEYLLFYAPANGIGVRRSPDLHHWRDQGPPITLGQKDWPWAETRLTAGYVTDLRQVPGVAKYILVCHSMGPGKKKTDANTNAGCSIVIAWSNDLKEWTWPGKGG